MLKERYKEDFIKAALLLNSLKESPERIDIIVTLHKLIIRGILKQEKLIRFDRHGDKRLAFFRKNKRPEREVSTRIKRACEKLRERIEERKQIIFLYKCFGDGIAYIYQSMYSLKHLYYNDSYQVKEDAGYISGKRGFIKEWKIFLIGIKYNVPVVMSDITNIIRNGDVCALGGDDPLPIEVKLTKHEYPGARAMRQLASISEIVSFYENDYAKQFRGGADAYRIPLSFKQIDYIDDINKIVIACENEIYAYKEVEKGIVYFCINTRIREDDLNSAMKKMKSLMTPSSTLTITLTPEPSWEAAYPFTLSLSCPSIVRFIYDEVMIFILVNLDILRSFFITNGIHTKIIMDGTSAIYVCKEPDNLLKGAGIISERNFFRNAISFLSFKVFADECSEYLLGDKNPPKTITHEMYETYLKAGQIVDENMLVKWGDIKDCLDE